MTLARIVEPELMDTEADALGYHAMDFSASDGDFADTALGLLRGGRDIEIVDFGTGTAKIPVLMAKKRVDLKILALDPAGEMLRVAFRHVAENDLSGAITTVKMDGRTTGLPAGRADFVMCNSTVHHLHDPLPLFREMKRVLRPGGGLLMRDLERPATMDAAWGIVKSVAAGDSRKQQQLFFDSLCAALTDVEVRRLLAQAGWGELDVVRSSDRHWSVSRALAPR